MTKSIRLDGESSVEIRLRRSSRARRLSLRVSSLDGRVTMTVPSRLPIAEAVAFVDDRRDWILEAQAASRASVRVAPGIDLPVEGRPRRIVQASVRAPALDTGTLTVPARAPARAAAAFLKCLARDRLASACDRHAAALGTTYGKIVLRDTRSRWGSCSQDGRLMFSWRLAMAPPEVLDYVAAHEVAHLRHMNHSGAFWDEVTRLYGDWRAPRRWLRDHGSELHRYRFS